MAVFQNVATIGGTHFNFHDCGISAMSRPIERKQTYVLQLIGMQNEHHLSTSQLEVPCSNICSWSYETKC